MGNMEAEKPRPRINLSVKALKERLSFSYIDIPEKQNLSGRRILIPLLKDISRNLIYNDFTATIASLFYEPSEAFSNAYKKFQERFPDIVKGKDKPYLIESSPQDKLQFNIFNRKKMGKRLEDARRNWSKISQEVNNKFPLFAPPFELIYFPTWRTRETMNAGLTHYFSGLITKTERQRSESDSYHELTHYHSFQWKNNNEVYVGFYKRSSNINYHGYLEIKYSGFAIDEAITYGLEIKEYPKSVNTLSPYSAIHRILESSCDGIANQYKTDFKDGDEVFQEFASIMLHQGDLDSYTQKRSRLEEKFNKVYGKGSFNKFIESLDNVIVEFGSLSTKTAQYFREIDIASPNFQVTPEIISRLEEMSRPYQEAIKAAEEALKQQQN